MSEMTMEQMLQFRKLAIDPLLDGVRQEIETSNAHQLQRMEEICRDTAASRAEILSLAKRVDLQMLAIDKRVSSLESLKLRLFGVASLIGTLVGIAWGSALNWARKHGWIQ